jgi:hypothetical protein
MAPLRVAHDLTDRQHQIFKPLLENESANLPVSAVRSIPRWQIVHCATISFI